MSLVPTIRTQPSKRDFALAALSVVKLGKRQVGVLWSQFAGETGRGYHCYRNNLGNVKAGAGWTGDYHALHGVWEGVSPAAAAELVARGEARFDPSEDHARAVGPSKRSVIFTAAHPASWFRSYASLDVGMASFIGAKRSGRYAGAWRFLEAGDCDGYARELGRCGYYTASPDAYSKAMLAMHREWMASDAFELALEAGGVCIGAACDELEGETLPTVDLISGATWILPFEIVHPRVDLPVVPEREW